MSWLGVQYALACRDERVKGSTRLVLVVLGARVLQRRITTGPTSLDDLWWGTFMSHEQLRRILDDLEQWGYVARLKRGKNAVYGMPGMAGPLFAVDISGPVKMTDFVIESLPPKTRQDARKATGRMTGFGRRNDRFSQRHAGGVLFSEVPSTQVPATTEERVAADGLIAWFAAVYPQYRDGVHAPHVSNREKHREAALSLLTGRSIERVQAMCVAGLTDTKEPWLNKRDNDRSLFAILRKSAYLEAIVVDRERPVVDTQWVCRHVNGCSHRDMCRSKLIIDPDGSDKYPWKSEEAVG